MLFYPFGLLILLSMGCRGYHVKGMQGIAQTYVAYILRCSACYVGASSHPGTSWEGS